MRAGLEHGKHHNPPPTTTVTSKTKHHHSHGHQQHPAKKTYVVVSGDTLAGIAAKTGTTVSQLEHLNPGIDPTALRVGQTIRVQ